VPWLTPVINALTQNRVFYAGNSFSTSRELKRDDRRLRAGLSRKCGEVGRFASRTPDREASTSPDPDSFGIFDQMEYLAGFGFVARQTCASAKVSECKLKKREALALGPKHRIGPPMIELINAAANYCKHSPEWSLDAPTPQGKRTLEAISASTPKWARIQSPTRCTRFSAHIQRGSRI
jgi:hypothetical protein